MKKILEKLMLFLNKKYGLTPDVLVYIKIFSAPLFALLISKILSSKSLLLAIIVIILYIKVIAIDFYVGILARAIPEKKAGNYLHGSILDQISGNILLIFTLIPFGLNVFTSLIILAELVLIFQNMHFSGHKEQTGSVKKIKTVLQILLIPILIIQVVTSFIPEMIVYLYIIATIIFTYVPIYTNYFYFEK